MRILTRYILKEIFSHSLIGLLVFTFVIFIHQLGTLLELVVRHNVPMRETATLFLLPFPSILTMTVPMAVLVGTLIGLSRMSADGEVIAARAAGMGLGWFVRPVMVLAVAGWALTLWMAVFIAPQAMRRMNRMESGLAASQVPYEIQPRVFIEKFPNLLLYIEDVKGSRSSWKGVFIADMTQHDQTKVTLAESGVLVNEASRNRFVMHLENGTTHEYDAHSPDQYSVASFSETDIPIGAEQPGGAAERRTPPNLTVAQLLQNLNSPPDRLAALVELNTRFALPVAAIVLALVGIPLGISTRKGGKSVGMMMSILVVFGYYILMASGNALARQGRVPPVVGLWIANVVFAATGIFMLSNLDHVGTRLAFLQEALDDLAKRWQQWRTRRRPQAVAAAPTARPLGNRFLQILDIYVMRGWIYYFGLLLVAFTGVYLIFDFFQVLGDIVRNQIPARIVIDYYRFLLPQVVYLMLPLSILVATLVNFGLLTKTNQVTAIKSAGVSLYRLSVPVLTVTALLSVGMFLFADSILPSTNQRQNGLRNQIKGKPPQTFFRPDHQWIFGSSSRIYNYTFFDPDQNVFANLSVYEFDPKTFHMTRRLYAARAVWESEPIQGWILEKGWSRDLTGDRVTNYQSFSVQTFKELTEEPGYFKKEVKPSEQMSAFELRRYIADLRQSGFDVVRLSVQFYHKFSYPLIAFVVTLIGIPFSFTVGRQGALTGIAVSIGIAIVYWSTSSLFEAMGNLGQLPPAMAAWSPDLLFGLAGTYLLLRVKT